MLSKFNCNTLGWKTEHSFHINRAYTYEAHSVSFEI